MRFNFSQRKKKKKKKLFKITSPKLQTTHYMHPNLLHAPMGDIFNSRETLWDLVSSHLALNRIF